MKINYLGNDIEITIFENDSDNIISKKLEFIKKLEDNNVKPNLVNKYTKLWYYMKYKHCKYPINTYLLIKKYDNNI
jgi:hypothetical protein